MRRVFLYFVMITCCSWASFGQSSPSDTLFSINETAYSSQSFFEFYKNRSQNQTDQFSSLEKQMYLYINFNLKLKEAYRLQIDTLPQVQKSIQNYRELMLTKEMYPTDVSEKKVQEAFQRIQYFLKARHILIKIKQHKSPKDTLEAYQKANFVYNALQKGKDFKKMAHKYSDDRFVKLNDGEIGYFTAFDMDYAFESAAYQLKTGETSKPVRTQFGYHIIQILERIPNPGKIKVRHLFLEFSKKSPKKVKQQAELLYQQLMNGANFEQLIESHSDDKESITTGGILPWFGLFETHPKIENAAFNLQHINDFSFPVETEYGYHIIKLLDKKEYKSIDESRKELTEMIKNDKRSKLSSSKLIHSLKKEYNFKENKKLLSNFYSILDYAYADLTETLFSIGNTNYSQEAFATYLNQQASKDIYEDFKEYIHRLYADFSDKSILEFHKKRLQNSKQFQQLLNDYKNSVLVHQVTQQKIGSIATENNEEVLLFFRQHPGDYKADVEFESVKDKVLSDFKNDKEKKWLNKLWKDYQIKINKPTFTKILNNNNE